ncbi:GntR family transcriptional regulator [Leucobacter sp. GX24907]
MAAAASGESLGARAYREIWQRIVHLDFPPLSVLDEKQLSAELGVGLSPTRQALRRLEYDGLIMILPRRGTLTTEVSLNAVQWQLEIRTELEPLAGRLAAARGTAEEHRALQMHLEGIEQLAASQNTFDAQMQFTDMDRDLHRMIYAQTRNPSLIADLNRHFAHALRIWFYCHRARPNTGATFTLGDYDVSSYRDIVTAIVERDGDRAAQAMREHVIRDTEDALSQLRGIDA